MSDHPTSQHPNILTSHLPIGFGGMPLSIQGRPSEEVGRRVLHAAVDAGMTLIDTADVYCLDDDDIGHNERLIASAATDSVHIGTKAGLRRPRGAWRHANLQNCAVTVGPHPVVRVRCHACPACRSPAATGRTDSSRRASSRTGCRS